MGEEADGGGSLLPWISQSSEWACTVRRAILKDGYVVLPAVFSRAEAEAELERMWDFVETISPGVCRDLPDTWYPEPGSTDPWPHTGWASFRDMFQLHQAGWLFTDLRSKLKQRVFDALYSTQELHSSKEGFTFHRPTANGRHPGVERPSFVCGKPSHSSGEHFDQRSELAGLECIQSSTALLDQDSQDGCFLCWPGSHREHVRLTQGTWRGRHDWVPLTDEELSRLSDAGLSPLRVPVKAGDVILWRSDLAHAAAPPLGPTEHFRAVVYTCMLPAALTPAEVLPKKLEAYRACHTGDHCPSREYWHTSKSKPGTVTPSFAPYFADGPPELTWGQAQMYGLVPFDVLESEESQQDAAARGIRILTPG